jgi:hypothetical protein
MSEVPLKGSITITDTHRLPAAGSYRRSIGPPFMVRVLIREKPLYLLTRLVQDCAATGIPHPEENAHHHNPL